MKKMQFQRLDGSLIEVDISDAKHVMIVGEMAQTPSILHCMIPEEWNRLQHWAGHGGDGENTVNLLRWPGWTDVVRRLDSEAKAGHKEAERLVSELLAKLSKG